MGVKKWLWQETGPTKEPRWLVFAMLGIVVLAVFVGLAGA